MVNAECRLPNVGAKRGSAEGGPNAEKFSAGLEIRRSALDTVGPVGRVRQV